MSLRDFGFGFDTLFGRVKEIAISPIITNADGAEGQTITFSLQRVTSIEDYQSRLDISKVSDCIDLFRTAPNQ